jgi:hypothetical protein
MTHRSKSICLGSQGRGVTGSMADSGTAAKRWSPHGVGSIPSGPTRRWRVAQR